MNDDNYIRKLTEKRDRDAKAHKVTELTNFCRVFRLPEEFQEGFCHGGGKPVNFQMMDWFNPVCLRPVTGLGAPETWEQAKEMLPDFIKGKIYYEPGRRYLVLTDFNTSLIIS